MHLTIIIPHYNLPRPLLERCLESVRRQNLTSEELQVLIIDDESVNPPLWVTTEYPDFQLICAKHGGLGSVRNIGMSKAIGDYLLFLDSDDFLEPESLKKCLQVVKQYTPDILRFNWRRTDNQESGGCSSEKEYPCGAAYMAKNNLSGMACSYLLRNDVIKRHNITFQTNVYHEDEEFTTRLHFHAGKLIDSNILVYNYYIRPDSITQDSDKGKREKRYRDILSMLRRIKSFRDENYSSATPIQRLGIDRKLAFLAVDTIINTIRLKEDWKELLDVCHITLSDMGLYPLPAGNYSFKYKLFRLLCKTNIGLRCLYYTQKRLPQR